MVAVETSPLGKEEIDFSIPISVGIGKKMSKPQNEISEDLGLDPSNVTLTANSGKYHTSFNFDLPTCKKKLIIPIQSILKWSCKESMKTDCEIFKNHMLFTAKI